MAKATQTIVLYREIEKVIIAEVFEGEQYFIPEDVSIYEGTLEEFKAENPDYDYDEI